jgi:DNA-binding MarR family transcriptional regulator
MANKKAEQLLSGCLYFTANHLGRVINRMAEEEFGRIGLSPTYGFLMVAILENEGATHNELSQIMHLTPSTMTRLIDKLVYKQLVIRKQEGRQVRIYATEAGRKLRDEIDTAWERLHSRYAEVLGREYGDRLTQEVYDAACRLESEGF